MPAHDPASAGATENAEGGGMKTVPDTFSVPRKAREYANGLEKWLKNNPNASYSDRLAAQSILDDLRSALGGQ